MNREAELEAPSRVACCSDLLDGFIVMLGLILIRLKPTPNERHKGYHQSQIK